MLMSRRAAGGPRSPRWTTACTWSSRVGSPSSPQVGWRTNGVSTNGAAAEVMSFDGLGKEVHPGTFGKVKVG